MSTIRHRVVWGRWLVCLLCLTPYAAAEVLSPTFVLGEVGPNVHDGGFVDTMGPTFTGDFPTRELFFAGSPGSSFTPVVNIDFPYTGFGDIGFLDLPGQALVLNRGFGSIRFSPITIPADTNRSTVMQFGEVMGSLQPCADFSLSIRCLDPVPLPPVLVDFPVVGTFQFGGVGHTFPGLNFIDQLEFTLAPEPKSLDYLRLGLGIAAVRTKHSYSRS